MIHVSAAEAVPLLLRAATLLGKNQEELGDLLRTSKRTVQRWYAGRSTPVVEQLQELARLAHPYDADLAAELAAVCHETLESLGIVAARPAPPAAPEPAPPPRPSPLVVDAVVCAAADAVEATPSSVRGVLLAAFERAALLGLTCEEVATALREATRPVPEPSPDATPPAASTASPSRRSSAASTRS